MRFIAGLVLIAIVAGYTWVYSLPNKAECVASGRVVDPTERHCEDSQGYQQLQEHALFHSRDVLLGGGILLAAGYGVYYFVRRRRLAQS